MLADLTGKPIVLTGASGGIGVALTDHLLSKGFRDLALQYRSNPEKLTNIVRKHGLDPDKHCFKADLAQERDVAEFGRRVNDEFGTIWGLVNLAGKTSNGMSWKLSLDQFQDVVAGNLTSTFLSCRQFIPELRAAGGGRIINISSVVAFNGVAGTAHYSAAKAGVVGFTRTIARELISKNVTANVLALGYFDYGMIDTIPDDVREGIRQQIPAGRFGTAPELASMLVHLLSPEGAYTTGQVLHINGGITY